MIRRAIILASLAGAGWLLYSRLIRQRSPAVGDTAGPWPDDQRGGLDDRVSGAEGEGFAIAAPSAPEPARTLQASGRVAPSAEPARTIKGNIRPDGERIYHLPGDPAYERTNAERWFVSVGEAEAAGFRRAGRPREG
jgi:hypothetical protein